LRPILIRVLLRVPARQMPYETRAKRLGPIFLLVRLRDRAEVVYPLLGFVKLVRVVDDMAQLVAQIAEGVGAAPALGVAGELRVQARQLLPSQVERNRDGDRAEGDAPFGG